MCVQIMRDKCKFAELYVSDVISKRYGLFTFSKDGGEREEMHFTDFSEGVSFLELSR